MLSACAEGGRVYAWGNNSFGACAVPAFLNNAIEVACGNDFSMALKADGTIVTWGSDAFGLNNVPAAATNVMAISTRGYDCMALRRDGSLVMWGAYSESLPGATGIVAIATGGGHHMALRRDGELLAWGVPLSGETSPVLLLPGVQPERAGAYDIIVNNQFGSVTSESAQVTVLSAAPTVTLQPASDAVSVGGSAIFAVRASGSLPLYYQWQHNGRNIAGETNITLSLQNAGFADAGFYRAVVTNPAGEAMSVSAQLEVVPVLAWGSNLSGVLELPFGLTNVIALAAGPSHNLAVRSDGSVIGWGDNSQNQSVSPSSESNWAAVAAGERVSLGLRKDGTVAAFGHTMVDPAVGTNVTGIVAGPEFSLWVKSDGSLVTWGWGRGYPEVPPAEATNIIAAAVGRRHALALRQDGVVVGWGYNEWGQAAAPASAVNMIAVAAGDSFSLGLRADGTVMAWGDNRQGQTTVPEAATNITMIAAGGSHALAARDDGRVFSWGDPVLGPGSLPPALAWPAAISAGQVHDLALLGMGEPRFIRQPVSQTVIAASRVSWGAPAVGLGPISYQWQRHGTNLPGATHAYLTLADAHEPNAGDYVVIISNSEGSATSAAVTLTVIPSAPVIIEQPAHQFVIPGTRTAFTVSAAGSRPLSYQWTFNGTELPNETNSHLILAQTQVSDGGDYQVTVTNSLGMAASEVAHLEIYPFNLALVLTNAASRRSAQWGDYDNDGRLDLLASGSGQGTADTVHLLHNLGAGSFVETAIGMTESVGSVAWGDFDNDGFLDILLARSGDAEIWRNNGDGTFTDLGHSLASAYETIPSLADFNRDGRLDVLLGSVLHQNAGNNQFVRVDAGIPTMEYSTTAPGDFDNDGWPDILICGVRGGQSSSRLYRNLGDGRMVAVNAGLPDIYPGAGAWLDFDQDGHLDVLLAGRRNPGIPFTALFRNNGDGTFAEVVSGLPAAIGPMLAAGDYDNDGRTDVFLSGDRGSNWNTDYFGELFRGDTDGSFVRVDSPFPMGVPPAASWGDYDLDGRLDLALSSFAFDQTDVAIYRSGAAVTNTPPLPPAATSAVPRLNRITFEWSAGFDEQTPAVTLTYGLRVGTRPGSGDVLVPDARMDGTRLVPQPGNAGARRSLTLTNLPFGRYYWAVQSVDSAFAGSAFTPEQVFVCAAVTLPAGGITASKSTLNGLFDRNALPAIAYFEWGFDTEYGNTTALQTIGTNAVGNTVHAALTGLLPGTAYHYRVVLTNSDGVLAGADEIFVTIDVPSIMPQDPREITANGATLVARANPNGSSTSLRFEYGLSSSYGNTSPQTGIGDGRAPVEFRQMLSGLLAGHTYHYRAVAENSAGIVYGPDQTLLTTSEPTVVTQQASNVGTTTAILNALVNANGLPTTVAFEYGLTLAYGQTTPGTDIGGSTNSVPVSLSLDFLTAASIYHVRVTATNAAGLSVGNETTFQTQPPFTGASNTFAGSYLGQSTFVDYNNDGLLDIHVLGTGLVRPGTTNTLAFSILYRNEGNGQLTEIDSGMPGVYWGGASWADFDNDGFQDVAIAGYSAGAPLSRIYRNHGDGTFTDVGAGLIPVGYGALAWGDYNNDGRADLLLTGNPTGQFSSLISRIYRNDGDGIFTDIEAGLVGVYQGSAAWGDYDNDGWADVLLTGNVGLSSTSRIYRNNGDGTFLDIGAALAPAGTSSCAWGDYNNDGRLDILLTGSTVSSDAGRFSQIYRNDGNGIFTALSPPFPGVRRGSAAWGDYDNDGVLDILLTGHGTAIIYRNNGDGTFRDALAGLTPVSTSSAAWGDLDGDGRLDVLVSGDTGSSRITRLYRNQNTATNSPPQAPNGLSAFMADGITHLRWGTASDRETGPFGLTYNVRIGTTPGGQDIASAAAADDGTRRVVRSGSAGNRTEARFTGLTRGIYYWSVQAIDSAFAGSPFGLEQAFAVPALTITASFNAAHALQLDFQGDAGATYRVQASSDLDHWTHIGTASEIAPQSFRFTDPLPADYPARYYRVSVPEL